MTYSSCLHNQQDLCWGNTSRDTREESQESQVCQKHYGKAEQYKLFWRGINRALQGVGIFLIKKWVVKVMSKQGK